MNFSDILSNPNVPDTGFDFDLKYDFDKAPQYDWSAGDEKPGKNFLDVFSDELQKSGYFDQSKEETKKHDVYGDRRRSSGSGDTVADLGGGNTAVNPNTSSLIQSQMAMLNQQQQPGMGSQLVGAGAAAGVSMIPGVGPFLAPLAGGLGSAVGNLLPF